MAEAPANKLPEVKPRAKGSWRWKLIALLILVVLAGGFAGYTWITLHISFSTGERVGYVQKLSKRGWVCKTWEGELAMVAMPGATPEKFYFTVWDDAVAARINQAMGERVSLHYEQKVGLPGSCFGETDYWVNDVKVVGEPQVPGMAPAPSPAPSSAPAPSN